MRLLPRPVVKDTMSKTAITFPAPPPPSLSLRKRHIIGGRAVVRVLIREISFSPNHHSDWVEQNPLLPVYDCSSPYTDPDAEIDLARGLRAPRGQWIEECEDTERLTELSSEYGRRRHNDLLTHDLHFPARSRPRRARRGLNVSQLHDARKSIITPETEFVALRDSMQLDRLAQLRRLDAGCEVLMPWAIRTGQGPRNTRVLRELRERAPRVALTMDAGIGLPPHAWQMMELSTAASRAVKPVKMAGGFVDAIRAGRAGFLAGQIIMQDTAVPGTPEIGRPFTLNSPPLPLRQSETKTINSGAAGSVIFRRGSGG
jgi:hypothetical protein